MNRHEFREAQKLMYEVERTDSILKYDEFYSLMVRPKGKTPTDHRKPVEKDLLGKAKLQMYIRKGIVEYREYLISELRDLGVEYE